MQEKSIFTATFWMALFIIYWCVFEKLLHFVFLSFYCFGISWGRRFIFSSLLLENLNNATAKKEKKTFISWMQMNFLQYQFVCVTHTEARMLKHFLHARVMYKTTTTAMVVAAATTTTLFGADVFQLPFFLLLIHRTRIF